MVIRADSGTRLHPFKGVMFIGVQVYDIDGREKDFNFFFDIESEWGDYVWDGGWTSWNNKYTTGLYKIGMIKPPPAKRI